MSIYRYNTTSAKRELETPIGMEMRRWVGLVLRAKKNLFSKLFKRLRQIK